MKKRTAASALAFVFVFLMLFQTAVPVRADGIFDKKVNEKKTETKAEGKGYDTPEEAVRAYAEALKEGDMEKMISTFAVESVVENYDQMAGIARVRAIRPGDLNSNIYLPNSADSVFRMNSAEKRRRMITKEIDDQLFRIATADAGYASNSLDSEKAPESLEALYLNGAYSFEKGREGFKEAEELVEVLSKTPDLSKMKIGEVLYAEGLNENYFNYANFTNLYHIGQTLGADGYRSLALHLTINGKEALLYMDTVKYGKKWYNYTMISNLALIMAVNTDFGGFIVLDDEWDEVYDHYKDGLTEAGDLIREELGKEFDEKHKALLEESGVKSDVELKKLYDKSKADSLEDYLAPLEIMNYEEFSGYFDLESL